jgi:cytoskeletal protein RodZ
VERVAAWSRFDTADERSLPDSKDPSKEFPMSMRKLALTGAVAVAFASVLSATPTMAFTHHPATPEEIQQTDALNTQALANAQTGTKPNQPTAATMPAPSTTPAPAATPAPDSDTPDAAAPPATDNTATPPPTPPSNKPMQ